MAHNIFFYTFRTNKFVSELEDVLDQKVYIVERPAKDFAKLKSAIEESGVESVVGIGMVKGSTRWESICYNRIGKSEINSGDPESLGLKCLSSKIPAFAGMTKVGKGMTFGFCNYVAYRISNEVKGVENSFLHLNPDDVHKL